MTFLVRSASKSFSAAFRQNPPSTIERLTRETSPLMPVSYGGGLGVGRLGGGLSGGGGLGGRLGGLGGGLGGG